MPTWIFLYIKCDATQTTEQQNLHYQLGHLIIDQRERGHYVRLENTPAKSNLNNSLSSVNGNSYSCKAHPSKHKKKKKRKREKKSGVAFGSSPFVFAKDPCEQAEQTRSPLELFMLWIKHIQQLGAVPRAPCPTRGVFHIPWKTLLIISAL